MTKMQSSATSKFKSGVILWVVFLAPSLSLANQDRAGQYSIELSTETRWFFEEGQHGNTDQFETSLRVQPDYSYSWDNSRKVIQFIPYLFLSDSDSDKNHGDIKELSFVGNWGWFELRAGVSKVFWGVIESVHLVDVINQSDFAENFDGEDKLGQPMIELGFATQLGHFSLFALPYFRQRTFPGLDGRLGAPIVVDADNAVYEASNGKRHTDIALRWESSISFFDLGISHFMGTSRDPILKQLTNDFLTPYYYQIHQTGLDVQATVGALLIKHESVYRDYRDSLLKGFYSQASGIEYTKYGVFNSDRDIGLIAEYLSASDSGNGLNVFDNDLFTGVRLSLNDIQGTDFLAGIIFDLDSSQRFLSIESSRRLSSGVSGSLEYRQFIDVSDSLAAFENESYIQLELRYRF